MGHNLRITDNTTTVTLTTGNFYLGDYTPSVSFDAGEPIRERLTVGFTSDITTIRGNVNSINKLFAQARNYNRTQTGARVYVEFDPGATGTYWRSMLYDGKINMNEDMLGGQWGASNLELEIEWVRQPFWEGALTQLTTYNAGTTDTTAGLTINNANYSSVYNYVDLYGTEIDGDLPAPIKIEMYNAYNTSDASDEIYIFHNVYSNPSTFKHILEGESSTNANNTSTTDATASGLAYGAIAWTASSKTEIGDWLIPSSDIDDAAGGRFSVLARWNGAFPSSDDYYMQLKIIGTAGALWVGDLVYVPNARELQQLDTVRIPPYLAGLSSIRQVKLSLFGLRSATDNAVNLDYLHLSPISGEGGWKRFKSVDDGIPYQGYFYHDATEGWSYSVGTLGLKRAEFTEYGGPIELVPGQNQRLYFVTCNEVGTASISQTWTIKVWYRPRRSSI